MKYIKKFEEQTTYKEFIIIKNSLGTFLIFGVISETSGVTYQNDKYSGRYSGKLLYQYNDNGLKKLDLESTDYSKYIIEDKTVYSSYNIDDCLDKLSILYNAKKFNL